MMMTGKGHSLAGSGGDGGSNRPINNRPRRTLPTNGLTLALSLLFIAVYCSFQSVSVLHSELGKSLMGASTPEGIQHGPPTAIAGHAANVDRDGDDPPCEELMRRPHSPYADGQFLSRRSTPVRWRLRSDHSRELLLPGTCRLKRYTSIDALSCLRDKHVMFVGDSLSRYQYLSLVHLLERDGYAPRFRLQDNDPCHHIDESTGGVACSRPGEPNVCAEGDWSGGWPAYQMNLGGGGDDDDGGVFRGRMESHSTRGCKDEGENMMYVTGKKYDGGLPTSSMEDDGGGGTSTGWKGRTKLSFAMEFGWNEESILSPGWNYTGCAFNGTCRYTQGQYDDNIQRCNAGDVDWKYSSVVEAFGGSDSGGGDSGGSGGAEETNDATTNKRNRTIFLEQYLDVNYVFYNRGLWGKIPEGRARRMMKLLHDFTTPLARAKSSDGDHTTNRCFYKSTTGCGRSHDDQINDHEHDAVRKATFQAGCEYMDVGHLTEEFAQFLYSHPMPPRNVMSEYTTIFWDYVHYQPWVYEELNNLLLNVLCNNA
jgi:hypothetical protein